MSLRGRLMPGDRVCLRPDDGSVAPVDVVVARSRGWAELLEVRTRRSDGSWASGSVALWPSGRWLWVKTLVPLSDETGG